MSAHLVWRVGREIRAGRADRATGLIAGTEVVATLPDDETPHPVVTADPDGTDATTRQARTELVWLGTAGDLRFTRVRRTE